MADSTSFKWPAPRPVPGQADFTKQKTLSFVARSKMGHSYRLMAGRLYVDLHNGKADLSGARDQIKFAHDALCEAFNAIERES